MGYIYCITSPSGKSYIGQTTRSYKERFEEHIKCTGSCILLENAIKKYGSDNLIFEVLLEINDKYLDEYEIKFIQQYHTLEPNGYNIRMGGSAGKHSDESRKRMSIAKLGEKNHNYGKQRTESAKLAISCAKSGDKHHFYGKTLSLDHKLKLAKAHRKDNLDLPMYMVYVKERPQYYQYSGYAIANHPTLKNKYFTSKTLSDDEKYLLATNYLNSA